MEMLTLSHVAKSFGSKQVLRDVSFSVPEHTAGLRDFPEE